jgi:hypothetical protein
MDIFFHDPDDVPLPPGEVRIRAFTATPYPDGRRVKVYLEVSPFQKKPSGEITILAAGETVVATANIIETVTRRMELTMHLRLAEPGGSYTARAELYYDEPLPEKTNGSDQVYQLPARIPVDSAVSVFTVG